MLRRSQQVGQSVDPKNSGKHWTPDELKKLGELAVGNTPTRVIALKLHRSPVAVQAKASVEGISLKPTNQSPYNRRRP